MSTGARWGPDALVALLAQRSLTVPTRDADRTVVHRLIQRVTRDRCRQAGDLDAVVSAAADALHAAADEAGGRWSERALLGEYADHAVALWQQPVADPLRPRLLALRGRMLFLLNQAHSHATSLIIGPGLVADCERVLGPDHPDTLASRNNLAAAYRAAGRPDDAYPARRQGQRPR